MEGPEVWWTFADEAGTLAEGPDTAHAAWAVPRRDGACDPSLSFGVWDVRLWLPASAAVGDVGGGVPADDAGAAWRDPSGARREVTARAVRVVQRSLEGIVLSFEEASSCAPDGTCVSHGALTLRVTPRRALDFDLLTGRVCRRSDTPAGACGDPELEQVRCPDPFHGWCERDCP